MKVQEIALSSIKPARFLLRADIKDQEFEKLKESIATHGIMQPILLRPVRKSYQIVAGTRRFEACKELGLKTIPAIVRELDDKTAFELALTENVQRKQLTPFEEARAFQDYLVKYKWGDMTELAKRINRYPSYIVDRLALLELPKKVQDEIFGGRTFSPSHARELWRLEKPEQMEKVAQQIKEEKLTREQTREVVELIKERKLPVDRAVKTVKMVERTRERAEEMVQQVKGVLVETDSKNLDNVSEIISEEFGGLSKRLEEHGISTALRQAEKREALSRARVEMSLQSPDPITPVQNASELLARRKITDEKRLNLFEAKEWMLFTKSWFVQNPPPRDEREELHPAKFPEPMIKDFIEFFTQPTAIVLDPFLGTGSTLVACETCNRQGIGVEIEEKYAKIAQRRTKQPVLIGDAMKLDGLPILKDLEGEIDFVITSPPYWNMLSKSRGHFKSASQIRADVGADTSYGENPYNLGNVASYEEYLDALYEVFGKVYKLLKNRRYLVVIVQNILTEDGDMKPVAWDLASKLSNLFLLKQEKIWCQDNKSLGFWGYPSRYVSSVHHHYCLVFEKVEKNESRQVS